jgi:hypothetical protein
MEKIESIEDISNGHEAITQAVATAERRVTISANDLRRLVRLQARAEGAAAVAQAAINAAQSQQQIVANAVQEACEDAGIRVPRDSQADVDWVTGEVTITPPPAPGTPLYPR